MKNVTMSNSLSHDQTKSDLKEHFAEKSLHYSQD